MKSAEDLVNLFFKNSNDFYCLHSPNGLVLDSSDSIYGILGFTKDEYQGKNPYDYIHPDDREYIQKSGHEPTLNGAETILEYRHRKADNSYIWLSTKSIPLKNTANQIEYIFTLSKPVSEIVNYKQAIKQKDETFDQVGNLARIGAWELDITNQKLWWSKITYDIHEVEKSFIPTLENALSFYPESDREVLLAHVDKAIEQGVPYDCKVKCITAKGNIIAVRAIGRPLMLYGKAIKLFGVFQDIQKEMEAEQSLKDMVTMLTTQKKQLIDFNQIVSHNLRSPVGNLSMLLSLLKFETGEKERNEIMDNINDVSASLQSLLNDLVDVVKITAENNVLEEVLSLKAVLQDVEVLLKGDLRRMDVKIVTDFDWTEVNYPRIYLESIFLNMLSNSLKYHSPNRALKIGISSKYRADKKLLIFSDNGSGIDLERHKDKIFKLHKTFHKEKPGKGLGLFMTKNQIESLGGTIEVESEPDKGTSFIISINEKIKFLNN